jgi:hypothetical protein
LLDLLGAAEFVDDGSIIGAVISETPVNADLWQEIPVTG